MTAVTLTVNGLQLSADIVPRTHLADFLRESQHLTGTHIGCEHGICGACTVEINGDISRSCITFAVACDGAEVRTIEGFDDDDLMARLRAAFSNQHALQCGYCTPGMLIAARDLIRRKRGLSEAQIRIEMSGNLCRCTGYAGIISAIARVMAEEATVSRTAEPAPPRGWLGPAPGPIASDVAKPGAPMPALPKPKVRKAAATVDPARRIDVQTSAVRQEGPTARLSQSFVIDRPLAQVWSQLRDLATVVACMPGAGMDSEQRPDGSFDAHLALRLGPIRTTFAGVGVFTSDAMARSCRVVGSGNDRGGPTSVKGEVVYRLSEVDAGSTRVDAEIGYAVTGPLAQFGRPALVHGLVAHIGEAFAANLNALADGHGPVQSQAPDIRLLPMIWSLLVRWLDRLSGK